jgi:hypothetical protein
MKRIEYRKQTRYWKKRLEGRKYDLIRFRNGYASKAPEMLVEFCGVRRYGKGRNGCYAIQLGRVLKIKRWKP